MDDGFCWVARNERGTFAACADRAEWAKETAKDVARWIRSGARVERVPAEQARAELSAYIKAKQQNRKDS